MAAAESLTAFGMDHRRTFRTVSPAWIMTGGTRHSRTGSVIRYCQFGRTLRAVRLYRVVDLHQHVERGPKVLHDAQLKIDQPELLRRDHKRRYVDGHVLPYFRAGHVLGGHHRPQRWLSCAIKLGWAQGRWLKRHEF